MTAAGTVNMHILGFDPREVFVSCCRGDFWWRLWWAWFCASLLQWSGSDVVVGLLMWWWCGVVGLEVVVQQAWWAGGRLGLEVVGSSSGAWADQSHWEEHQD